MEGDLLPCVDPIQNHVEGVAKLLHNTKANSPDNLPACFLQEVSSEIAPALPSISITGPGCFARGLDASSDLKKGNRLDPCSSRPISLTCICAKMLEHIM